MNLLKSSLIAAAVLVALPLAARAESKYVNGATGTLTANANLDFRITVPRVLYLRVGAGTDRADNAAINLIDFAPSAAVLGDGTPVAGTGGDIAGSPGAVTARLMGNGGDIQLKAVALGALGNGNVGETISFSQIATAATTLTSAVALPAPALTDGTSGIVTVSPASGSKVVNRDAKWTFSYLNSAVVAPGTYGGVNTNNGRVTYTASMP